MGWFLVVDVFLLAGVGIIVRKKGLNVSFFVSSLVIAAWYFYGSIGFYDTLGLISLPILLFCLVYIVCVFLQILILRLFGGKMGKIEEKSDRTKDEAELVCRFRRASEEDRQVITLILSKYEQRRKKDSRRNA